MTDIDEIWYSDASAPSRHRQPMKFGKLDNQDGGGLHLKKLKNRNMFVSRKFGMVMCVDPPYLVYI